MDTDEPTPDESAGTPPPPDPATPETTSDAEHSVIVGVSFDRPLLAQEFLIAMQRLRQDGTVTMTDAVIVTKQESGRVVVTETIDPSPGRAAITGALWTGLLGLILGGPVGWLAGLGIGAGAGAVTAKVIDLGLPDEWVAWFRDAVAPGTSTIVVLADSVDMPALTREAARFSGAELLHTTLPPGAYEELAAAFGGHHGDGHEASTERGPDPSTEPGERGHGGTTTH